MAILAGKVQRAVIGLDLGTGGARALVVLPNGKIIGEHSIAFKEYHVAGRIEQNPQDWLKASKGAIKKAVSLAKGDVGDNLSIAAMGISGQMHPDVLYDAQGTVLARPTLWNSSHNSGLVARFADHNNRIIELNGNALFTRSPALKLLWRMENQPAIFNKVQKFTTAEGLIARELTGEDTAMPRDEAAMSHLMGLDGQWNDELFGIFGLPTSIRPRLLDCTETAGHLRADIAKELGLTEGIPVVIGGGDQTTGLMGNGGSGIILGTSGVASIRAPQGHPDPKGFYHYLPDGLGHNYFMGCSMNTAGALKWWSDLVFNGKAPEDAASILLKEIKKQRIPIGSGGEVFIPAMNGSNHPIRNSSAKGVLFGMQASHTRAHSTRAVLEGASAEVVRSFKDIMDLGAFPVDYIILSGGGAKDGLKGGTGIWTQMIADMSGLPVRINQTSVASGLGAAMFAGLNSEVGFWSSPEEAVKSVVKLSREILPIEANRSASEEVQTRFFSLFETLSPLFSATGPTR